MSTDEASVGDESVQPTTETVTFRHLLTADDGTCAHRKRMNLARDIVKDFEVTEVTTRSEARSELDDAYDADDIVIRGDQPRAPDATIHTTDCKHATPTEPTEPEPQTDSDPDTTDQEEEAQPEEETREEDAYTRKLEERVDALEETVDRLTDTIHEYEAQLEQTTHGLTELQANRLARGAIISRKGADVDRLNSIDADGLDLDVTVAHDRSVVRASNTKIGDSGTAVNELPDFDSLIPLEADRQKLNYGVKSRDEFDTVTRRRAVDVWQDIHVLNSNNSGAVIIEQPDLRAKVRGILEREGNPQQGDSLSETTRRVRDKLMELSDGVFKKDEGSRPHHLIASLEDVQDARLEDAEVAKDEDGAAMVLNGGK